MGVVTRTENVPVRSIDAPPSIVEISAVVVLLVAQFMANMDTAIANLATPSIAATLHTNGVGQQWVVAAYTLTSAYAEFAEKDKGSLEPGKLADLAVLSQDIFKVDASDLPKTESVLTLVGGKIVYDGKVIQYE